MKDEKLKKLKDALQQQVRRMENGSAGTHYKQDGKIIDTTDQSIADAKAKIDEIDTILGGAGRG